MHYRPHIDEIYAYFLLLLFGDKFFPGIRSAKLIFIKDGHVPSWMKPLEYVALGFGGGRFDEHATATTERKKKATCTTLVAEFLGVSQLPEVAYTLEHVYRNDMTGRGTGQDLMAGIRTLYSYFENPSEGDQVLVINWVVNGLQVLYDLIKDYSLDSEVAKKLENIKAPLQLPFIEFAMRKMQISEDAILSWKNILEEPMTEEKKLFDLAVEEFAASGKTSFINRKNGKKLKLAVVVSDNPRMKRYLTSKKFGADIVVLKNSKGNVSIFSQLYRGEDIVSALRVEERKGDPKAIQVGFSQLRAETCGSADCPSDQIWYHQLLFTEKKNDVTTVVDRRRGGSNIFNGSLTKEVPPTKLGLEKIVDIVSHAMDDTYFFTQFADGCRKGICVKSQCPLYKYGFARCGEIRSRQYAAKHNRTQAVPV